MPYWEPVTTDTQRLAVPGGWLYTLGRDTLVFVPAPVVEVINVPSSTEE